MIVSHETVLLSTKADSLILSCIDVKVSITVLLFLPEKNANNSKLWNDINRSHMCIFLTDHQVSIAFRLNPVHQYILRPVLRIIE